MECCGLFGEDYCSLGCVNFSPNALDGAVCDCGHMRFRHRVVASDTSPLTDQVSALTDQVARLSTLVAGVSNKQDEMGRKQDKIDRVLKGTNSALAFVVEDVLDPWSGIRSRDGSSVNGNTAPRKQLVLQFYGIDSNVCMILGKCTTSTADDKNPMVLNAHLWPNHTMGKGLVFLELESECVNSARNFLRLHHKIEHAFDRHEVTLEPEWDEESSSATADAVRFRLKVNVLSPELLGSTERVSVSAVESFSWSDLHGKTSHWVFETSTNPASATSSPYTRILAQHMHAAINKAQSLGWIDVQNMSAYRERALLLLRHSLPRSDGFGVDK